MNEDSIKMVREAIFLEKRKLKEYEELKDMIRVMETNPIVSKYRELLSRKENFEHITPEIKNYDEDTIIRKVYRRYQENDNDLVNIYFYIGSYINCNEPNDPYGYQDISVSYDDSRADYSFYINIENDYDKKYVKIKDRKEFEHNHQIIFVDHFFKGMEYYRYHGVFVKTMVNEGKDKAVKRILDLNK